MNRGRPWGASDRTGGPVDDVFDQLRERLPGVIVERLQVTHRADDDNVYFIGSEHGLDLIQLDTADSGQPPFLIENGGRHQTSETSEAATIVLSWLETESRATSGPRHVTQKPRV